MRRKKLWAFALILEFILLAGGFLLIYAHCAQGLEGVFEGVDGRKKVEVNEGGGDGRIGRKVHVVNEREMEEGRIKKALRLLTKFSPGMTYEDSVKLLSYAATSHNMAGDKDFVRKGYIHGEFGVEIYFYKDQAYRIDVLLRCANKTESTQVMNSLLAIGRKNYKIMPEWNSTASEYYWVDKTFYLAYAKVGEDIRISRKAKEEF